MTENNLSKDELNALSANNLAYLGDCVYELYVREYLVKKNVSRASVESLKYVTAHVQSGVVEKILPLLTPDEEDAYRRGRNLGHTNTPKSSTVAEYRRATGLEALFGWLYLGGRHDRLRELFEFAFSEDDAE
ncbi:MAG: Mini-ribonuclease 3 [Eubacteriales bacterium]